MKKKLVRLARWVVDKYDPRPDPFGEPTEIAKPPQESLTAFVDHPALHNRPKRLPKDKIPGILHRLPVGGINIGPDLAEAGALNELYNKSDNPGFLPTDHFYLYLDGKAVTVCRKKVWTDEPGLYLTSWNYLNKMVVHDTEKEVN